MSTNDCSKDDAGRQILTDNPTLIAAVVYVIGGQYTLRQHPSEILDHRQAFAIMAKVYEFYDRSFPDEITEANAIMQSNWNATIASDEEQPAYTPQSGYVYLLYCAGLYKIGITTRTVEDRVKDLERYIPHPIEIIHAMKNNDILVLEAALHQRFNAKRVKREWFDLTQEDIEYIKSLGGDA